MSVFGPPVSDVYQVTTPSFFAPSYSIFSRSGRLYAASSAIDLGLPLCAELGIGAQSRISSIKTIKRINILQFFSGFGLSPTKALRRQVRKYDFGNLFWLF